MIIFPAKQNIVNLVFCLFLPCFRPISPNFNDFSRKKRKMVVSHFYVNLHQPCLTILTAWLIISEQKRIQSRFDFWYKKKQFHCQSHLWDLFKLWKLWRKSRLHWLSSQAVGQALDRNLVAVNGWLAGWLVRLLGICLGLRAVHMNIVGLNLAPASIVQNWPL